MNVLDSIVLEIIEALRENSRISFTEIARRFARAAKIYGPKQETGRKNAKMADSLHALAKNMKK